MKKQGSGLEAGRQAVRLLSLRLSRSGGVTATGYHELEVEPGEPPLEAASALNGLRRRPAPLRIGLGGSEAMLRYLPVPPVEDWRLERLMDFEVREIEARSGSSLATSYNLLPVPKELDEDDTILLALAREDLLEEWMQALNRLPVQGFTPNPVALYNAWLALGDHEASTTLLACVGEGGLDLALVHGPQLYFARSVTAGLEKAPATLARALGTDAARARRLLDRHLDLRAGAGQRLSAEADRVTRAVLPLYEPVPTLLQGMVTLCKAQARLRDLELDRVLVTGEGARTRGLLDFLQARLRVPVEIWDPVALVDPSGLPAGRAADLEAAGPAATLSLGLALSAADPDLYALEILPEAARRKREFRERGVFAWASAALAAAFLAWSGFHQAGIAGQAKSAAAAARRAASALELSDQQGRDLLQQRAGLERLVQELETRHGLRRTAGELLAFLRSELPGNLWVQTCQLRLEEGPDWGYDKEVEVPVFLASGRGENRERNASAVFAEFSERLAALLPAGEQGILVNSIPGRQLEWTLRTHLLAPPAGEEELR